MKKINRCQVSHVCDKTGFDNAIVKLLGIWMREEKKHFQRFLAPGSGSESRLALLFCFFLQVLTVFPVAWQLQSPLVKPHVAVPFLSLPSTSGLPASSLTVASMHMYSLWRSMCLCSFVVIPEILLYLWEPPFLHAALLESCKKAQGVLISRDYCSCSQEMTLSFGIHESLVYTGTLSF